MTIERALRALAGIMTLLSIVLAVYVSHWWLLLTTFVGLNLLQSAFTNTCPAVWMLGKVGLKRCVPQTEAR